MTAPKQQRVGGLDAWGRPHSWLIEWRPLPLPGNDPALDNIGMTPVLWEDECPVGTRQDNQGDVALCAWPVERNGQAVAPIRVHKARDLTSGCWRVVEELTRDQWDVARVAEHLGVSPATVRAYRARGQMPDEDGRLGRSPWWWSDTITEWERPGQGVGGGRPRGQC